MALRRDSLLSQKNRQRLYNFFAQDTSAGCVVSCTVATPGADRLHLELDLEDDLCRQWYFAGYTRYECGVVELLWRLFAARSYRVVIEIGANVGYFSLLLAAAVRRFATTPGMVHVFEPNEHVFRMLERNAALNPQLALRLNREAVADVDGAVPFYLPAAVGANSNASLVAGLFAQQSPQDTKAIRLDSYCWQQGITAPDLVKMDCEGAEPRVFLGMEEMLKKGHTDLICEVLPSTAAALDDIFRPTAYTRYLIAEEGLRPVDRIEADAACRDYFLTTQPLDWLH
jgi:FkbM family methyltransferase